MTTAKKKAEKAHARKYTCPVHRLLMVPKETVFDGRMRRLFECKASGCTVACWDGATSLPGDKQTRRLRRVCHLAFDALWKDGRIGSRSKAYHWLQKQFGFKSERAHIGMFTFDNCVRLLCLIAKHFGPKRVKEASHA